MTVLKYIYTNYLWLNVYSKLFIYRMDATLREITSLVKEVNPDARRKGTMFDFSIVYPNPATPGFRFRDIGSTISGQKGPDDAKTLTQIRLSIFHYTAQKVNKLIASICLKVLITVPYTYDILTERINKIVARVHNAHFLFF